MVLWSPYIKKMNHQVEDWGFQENTVSLLINTIKLQYLLELRNIVIDKENNYIIIT